MLSNARKKDSYRALFMDINILSVLVPIEFLSLSVIER